MVNRETSRPSRTPGWRARLPALLLIGAAYVLTNNGGVVPADSEVVFRVAESLAAGRGFAIERPLELWPGFGMAKGRDGRLYSVFGPGESLALAPFVALVQATGLPQRIGMPPAVSYYVGNGQHVALGDEQPTQPEAHALRFLVSFFNVLVSWLTAWVFWEFAYRLTHTVWVTTAGTLAFALGTLAWTYSGTYFSEPLLTLCVLVSLWLLARCDPALDEAPRAGGGLWFALSGAALGMGVLTHVTGVLFIPFFGLYALLVSRRRSASWSSAALHVLPFVLGLAVPLLWLGWYNATRFGSPFETGRTVDKVAARMFGYGVPAAPWRGLYGFLAGGSRSLFAFAPPVLVGLAGLPALARRQRGLAWLIAGAALARVVFIASRSDWHGGFGPGPRLLVALLPLLALPAACLLAELANGSPRWKLTLWWAPVVAGIAVQAYLSLGEVFTFSNIAINAARGNRTAFFKDDRFYLDWSLGPLGRLHLGFRGPWLLKSIPLDNLTLWFLLTLSVAGACFLLVSRERRQSETVTALAPE